MRQKYKFSNNNFSKYLSSKAGEIYAFYFWDRLLFEVFYIIALLRSTFTDLVDYTQHYDNTIATF